MLVYIFLFLIVFCLLQIGTHKLFKSFNLYKLVYIIIFLFSAFRFDVGYDFPLYYKLVTKQHKFIDAQLDRLEPLSKALIELSYDTGFFQLFFILTSFIIVFFTYKTIKKNSTDRIISTLIFLSFPIFFFNSLSIVRQYVAVSLMFFSYTYIKSRKLIPFLVITFFAFLFHKSAIVAIPLYWIYNLRFKNIHFFILFVASFFSAKLLYLLVAALLPDYIIYLDKNVGVGGDKILLVFQLIGFFMLFFIDRKKNNSDYRFYTNTFFIGLFIWSSLAPTGMQDSGAAYILRCFLSCLFQK
ncbi:EpsG family protein [Jejuia pallidilutea]|uniref:Capsular polysaccharide biosynthesis protein n=1 Tax=Jejuia pallidilutea TaxID=504487 RepID=A0A090VPN3_9FLAO|nr:EpsG family protein [Jejuia pallidilutea]GAL65299.1 capsular polysaccharide biosynthesis protein [Jejuia pallidilutea]GAL69360.1 capsular polysaccharide biosynthesis protein [Jejuia pallidilutea]